MIKVFFVMASTILVGCASVIGTRTEFIQWRDSEIYQGRGGAVKVIDGIEYWEIGEPEKPFRIVGYIRQNAKEGLGYQIVFGALNRDEITKQVRSNGGSGVIKMSSKQYSTGSTSSLDAGEASVTTKQKIWTDQQLVVFRYIAGAGDAESQ